ncbi:diphosphomevalonate decarboxylase [Enterococcus sp. BWT-B8]|uniref:diphosphomevalonate decarboxylase n=1 Tax=unclassified Enterococcus TaxID=2608891 RepID=UPI001E59CDD5|nr:MULTISPECIES: diphosphomevalonate decarboxylase [unclassified Enterococcus]MCB5952057.1 diphosphomevalonate decarboxylase [Enterococcus sp. BWT-B8]MCB5954534.1 diphosphomevalonate decarboxylase [Enterococcus sp. CWB-B31]
MKVGKARAYTNIALIKYWGKKDDQLILPMNSSLSLTLDTFYTETTVSFDSALLKDQFYLNDQLQNEKQTEKISRFLDIVRKNNQTDLFAHVKSHNFVPTAAGLASSASGLAALAGACSAALNLDLSPKELSILARRGSGSACRSIFGGFAEWKQGDSDSTSYAEQIPADSWENDLSMLFVLVNDAQKDISSRDGMKRTVETSVFYEGWLKAAADDLSAAKQAIKNKDFISLGKTAEANALRMHATTLGATPPFTYWSPDSLKVMNLVRRARTEGIPCYFTMDAGPNVKILVQRKDREQLFQFFSEHFDKKQLILADSGPGLKILSSERSLSHD